MSEVFFIFVLVYIIGIKMNKSIVCKNLVPSTLRDKNMNKRSFHTPKPQDGRKTWKQSITMQYFKRYERRKYTELWVPQGRGG